MINTNILSVDIAENGTNRFLFFDGVKQRGGPYIAGMPYLVASRDVRLKLRVQESMRVGYQKDLFQKCRRKMNNMGSW